MEKKLELRVSIDPKSGFCFGVVNAIKLAEESLSEGDDVYCVGQIVHNDEEMNRLEALGLITIDHDALEKIKNARILFRAHGEPISSYRTIEKNNNRLIDASCPIILKLQDRIKKAYQRGEYILIYGKPNHPEVIALKSQTEDQAVVFQKLSDIDFEKLPRQVTLYSQTTQSLDEFNTIVSMFREKGIQVKVHDTICRQVFNREEKIAEFSRMHDKIVFVAGKNSSNGKVLYNVCKKNNPNTYFVSTFDELKKEWFSAKDHVGICGATSTPFWLMNKIKEQLESL